MWQNLSTNQPMFVYTFQFMRRHRLKFGRVLSFSWNSQFQLGNCSHLFKMNVAELTEESAYVCLHFSVNASSQAFDRVLSFSWNSRCALP